MGKKKDKKGIIFVISAPSGTGKTTMCEKLVEECPEIYLSISTTTRAPRKGEKEGEDYFFITKDKFRKETEQNAFVEWTQVLGNYYGTEFRILKKNLDKGEDVLLSLDVEGGKAIKESYPDSVLIFLLPPSFAELKNRLRKRRSETSSELQGRLKLAETELKLVGKYDYIVTNNSIRKAVDELKCIVISERCKTSRYNLEKIIQNLMKTK